MNVCDVYNIDPANLKRIEELVNSGLVELKQDIWNGGKYQFFCAQHSKKGQFPSVSHSIKDAEEA